MSELARRTGGELDASYVRKIVQGENHASTVKVRRALARGFGVSEGLMGGYIDGNVDLSTLLESMTIRTLAIRELRARHNLSQEELASRSGVAQETISRIERGATRRPNPADLSAIAKVFGLAAEDLHSNVQPVAAEPPRPRRESSPVELQLLKVLPDAIASCDVQAFDAARAAAVESEAMLGGAPPDTVARMLFDAARHLVTNGVAPTTVSVLARAVASAASAR